MKLVARVLPLLLVAFAIRHLASTESAPPPAAAAPPAGLEVIRLPPGFSISIFAGGVQGARSLAMGEKGTLFVGTLRTGRVYALRDRDGDHKADDGLVILDGLPGPNGVDVHDGDLYVGAASRILRVDDIEANLEKPPQPVVVTDQYPSDQWHGWRYTRFGPDGRLYVAVGAPCNVCEKDSYGTITRIKPDGSEMEVFASGVRNSVGFDWHPETKELWFTDNGRDQLGDNVPPDELNRAPKAGMHFGFPYCHGGDISDPKFGAKRPCSELAPPEQKLGPHVAALGMRFYTGTMFPEEYRGAIFIAEHGSWNRSKPIGYRVMVVRPNEMGAKRYQPFAEGWLSEDGKVRGRPVDVLVAPDGALLVSDDGAGVIYRISYKK